MDNLWNIEALRLMIKKGFRPSISKLVAANRQAATDPRDLVYAFLGLAKERDDPLLMPNYSTSAPAVFLNLIEYSVRVENSLDIICSSQGRIRNGIPSWCPDWTQPPRLGWDFRSDLSGHAPYPLIVAYQSVLSNDPWHACGNKLPAATIIRSPPTLACKGLLVDVVEVIGEPIKMGYPFVWNRLPIDLHPWENLVLNQFKGLRREIAQSANGHSIFDVSDQYHRLMYSRRVTPRSTLPITSSLKAVSKLVYSSYRRPRGWHRKMRYSS